MTQLHQAERQMANKTWRKQTKQERKHVTALISPSNALWYLHEHRCGDMNIWISLINQQYSVFVQPCAQRCPVTVTEKQTNKKKTTLANLDDEKCFGLQKDIVFQLGFPPTGRLTAWLSVWETP